MNKYLTPLIKTMNTYSNYIIVITHYESITEAIIHFKINSKIPINIFFIY